MTIVPHITKVALDIVYCNDGINRIHSENEFLVKLHKLIDEYQQDDIGKDEIRKIDIFLGTLRGDDLETIIDGEENLQEQILENAPRGTCGLLNEIFDALPL